MAYYLITLIDPRCILCGKKATVQLARSGTDRAGTYCLRHGKAKLKALNSEGRLVPVPLPMSPSLGTHAARLTVDARKRRNPYA